MMQNRTHTCGELRLSDAGKQVKISGWMENVRVVSANLAFVVVRDFYGTTQVVAETEDMVNTFKGITKESTISVEGAVRERDSKTDKMATGDIEIVPAKVEVLGRCQHSELPFQINRSREADEAQRLKYRYLDLRNPAVKKNIILRCNVVAALRKSMTEHGFLEITTPILTASSPEGARDYLVPARNHPGKFYALPQAPQQFKQLLMTSGFDRYFQIARCYRDEDLRADRQPEFTQVDEEMSFVNEDDIMTINEGLIKRLWKEMLGVDVQTPFVRMPWDEAMGRFGSDKPDTRFGLEIVDVTDIFDGTEFKPFAAVLEQGGSIRAINAKGLAGKLTRKHIDKLGEVAKTYGAKGLAFSRLTEEGTSSSFEKFLTEEEKAALYKAMELETGDVLLIVSDADWVKACTALGQVRLEIGRKYGLIDPDKFNFLWVVDFPLFEYSEQEGRWMAMHHPFTLPKAEDIDKVETDPGACHAVAYDIVLNGVEMGGGSMRINDPALQDRMFKALGFTEEKARESFGFLMDAYKFGAPPHGGMAYGLDRMVMLMLKKDSIRDVIAFPKVQNAGEPMSGAPDIVDPQQLKDLSIALTLTE